MIGNLSGRPLILIIGAIGIIIIISILIQYEKGTSPVEWIPDRSTYNARPTGYKALYLLMERIGLPVERWEKTSSLLPDDAAIFIVIDPRYQFMKSEIRGLERWIEGGGILVVLDDDQNNIYSAFAIGVSEEADRIAAPIVPSEPTLYSRRVQWIRIKGGARFRSFPSAGVVHFADPYGAVMVTLKKGAGKAICLSIPELVSNRMILDQDNLILFLNILLVHEKSGRVLIDEYHHGYSSSDSLVQYLLKGAKGLIFFQGILLCLAMVYTKGRRFGSPEPLLKEERRSSLEYIHSMANLFQMARAKGPALNAIMDWVKKDLFKELGLSTRAGMEELAFCLAERGYKDPEAATRMLTDCQRKIHEGKLGNGELLELAKGLYQIRETIKERGGKSGRVRASSRR